MRMTLVWIGLWIALPAVVAAGEPLPVDSPGLSPSQVDAQGRLVEDWGTVSVRLGGEGVVDGPTTVEAATLDGGIPAVRAVSSRGAARLAWTVYRAPAFPAGVDVLSVRVEETAGRAGDFTVGVDVPAAAKVGSRTVRIHSRNVLTLPSEALADQELRDWGYADEAVSLRGWAKPEGECDAAMRNIRAGMGGVPIEYQFAVKPKSRANVMLGFCESHWAEPRGRPLLCRVEGAAPQVIDPVGKWGRHKPGGLVFAARDQDGNGRLLVTVTSAAGARDRNPILNAIWIFPPRDAPDLANVLSGSLNDKALRYVDAGGENDQSVYPPGKLECRVSLPAGGAKELVFLVACPGGTAPIPDISPWTVAALRQATLEVWRDWPR